jgi:hypothetical protein
MMAKVIALVTEDFAFFHDAVRILKEMGEPFISLGLSDPIPLNVSVVMTTEGERGSVEFDDIVSAEDAAHAVLMAIGRAKGGQFERVVVGIDPGPRPGIAVLADGKEILMDVLLCPEEVGIRLADILGSLQLREIVLRIGHGDPTNRDRAILSAWKLVDMVEVVDETSTTLSATRPDAEAALRIASMKGERLPAPPEVTPTSGELRDIQRLSRIESKGMVTISSQLAEAVAKGEMTLAEAVRAQLEG